jgi:thioredoxin 1
VLYPKDHLGIWPERLGVRIHPYPRRLSSHEIQADPLVEQTLRTDELLVALSEANFQQEVLENPQPVLVEVGAGWSGACEIMAPILCDLAVEFRGRITFAKMNIAACERVARRYGVSELPFLLFFRDGQLVDHLIGIASRKVLQGRLEALLVECLGSHLPASISTSK